MRRKRPAIGRWVTSSQAPCLADLLEPYRATAVATVEVEWPAEARTQPLVPLEPRLAPYRATRVPHLTRAAATGSRPAGRPRAPAEQSTPV